MVIETNDPSNPQIKVACTGMVRGAFKDAPSVLNFGLIDPGALEITQTVTLIRGDGGPIAPKIIQSQTPGLSAEIKEIRPGEHYEMSVRLTRPLAMGQLSGFLMVDPGLPEGQQEAFRVLGIVAHRVQVTPVDLRLPAKVARETDWSAHVFWHAQAPHKILSAMSSDPKLEPRIVIAGRSQEVFVKVPADYELPDPPPTITVKTDDPTRAELVIPVRLEEAQPAADTKTP